MLNYLKQPKTKALFATIATFFCIILTMELSFWVIKEYGNEILAGIVFVSMVYFLWSLYEYFLKKYKNKNTDNDASN